MKKIVIYVLLAMIVGACGVKKNITVSSNETIATKKSLHMVEEHINNSISSISTHAIINEDIREVDTAGRTTRHITRRYEIKENNHATTHDTITKTVIDTSTRHTFQKTEVQEKSRPSSSYKIYLWCAVAAVIVIGLWWIKKKLPFL